MNNETMDNKIDLSSYGNGKIADYYRLGLDIGIGSVGVGVSCVR